MSVFLDFKRQLKFWLEHIVQHVPDLPEETILLISFGPKDQRCNVWHTDKTAFSQATIQLLDFIGRQFSPNQLPDYIKIDVAYNLEKQSWSQIEQLVHHQFHNNHYRRGIAFDEACSVVFLEQEIYGKAIIRGLSYDKPNFFDETNLNYAIKQKHNPTKPQIRLQELQDVWTFDTYATFYENGQFINLASRYDANGIRGIATNKKQHFRELIEKNAAFLHSQIQENGKFIYGYFPAFDRDIRSYNTVRHCTSLYALLETFEVQDKPEYLPKIVSAIQYALTHFYKEKDFTTAFMIDGKEGEFEIKLGANAAAILMLTKYQEITQKFEYLKYAEKLANGILKLVDSDGLTTHVLNYPDYDLKEKFRIIYYDGEAALALLRLYQINHDKRLLETVKLMFENFIHKRYEKYHDHWLSYCTNELTKICPEEKYFIFGLNNYLKHFIFIRNRKTTYATLLEMLMAAYKMVNRLKEQGHQQLLEQAYMSELKKLIKFRAEFQTTGFFYPEMAMYMDRPDKILHAFYVRHDRFRVRIDDQEHNLSGYIAYVKDFEGEEI
ncbi:poly alpha-glucosyltransferase [uncultured Acinetobacter sp.]|uniref:poly alpha-glucosyltransferase n=1 Tax=uncultured Acinetobacter sp. TaxID=165433 RepID=UPI00258C9C70|nr:poly alpha-glucosyltransferase [uncultured Acinetobacter sp.]